jgi:hypothetical protein
MNEDARVMVYHRKPVEEAINQLWTIELADPPRMIDSDDEDEDDSKRERMKAWFGNWKGWGHKKHEVLAERDLEEANKKVYKEKKSKARYRNTKKYKNEIMTNNDVFKKVMNSLLLRQHTKLLMFGKNNKKKKVKKFNMLLLKS